MNHARFEETDDIFIVITKTQLIDKICEPNFFVWCEIQFSNIMSTVFKFVLIYEYLLCFKYDIRVKFLWSEQQINEVSEVAAYKSKYSY